VSVSDWNAPCVPMPGRLASPYRMRSLHTHRLYGRSTLDGRGNRFDGEAAISPAREAALEGSYPCHAPPLEGQRHPGARRLVRSRAVHDDLAVTRNLLVSFLQALGRDPEGTRNYPGRGGDV
jgi:hypothetical protein